jgi:outer membrane protein assembly factor BamB
MMNPSLRRLAALAFGALSLAGCSDWWFGTTAKAPLPGERFSVLSLERRREPDPAIAQLAVRLPRPVANAEWPDAGGYPNHAMQHLALGDDVKKAWSVSVGSSSSRAGQLLATPVIVGNRLYSVDASSSVRAFDSKTGQRLWEADVKPEEERGSAISGGLAFAEDRVFVATGYGQVVALDANTGKEIWRQAVAGPVHGAPTVADGRVFVVSVDNQLDVLATDDGRKLWRHNGTVESAGLLGGSSPAVEGEVVVVPYSSGEIFALRVENGRPLWSDSLAATRRIDAMSTLADIRGLPVIDRGRVFAVSHSGRLVSIDLRTGERAWEQEVGGTSTPWVAGDFVYVLSNEGELICLTRRDGRVKWVQGLPRYENPEKKRRPLQWTGPILAGDRLVVVASNGEVLSLSPYTGEALGRVEVSDGTYIPPVLAGETLYILTNDADLIAMR